ncbi:Epimerase domain-containing protein [Aphelenchoides bicaudatus]|nr:Epimerase domain-containing protein [Aphelenchoides bicaudatus]
MMRTTQLINRTLFTTKFHIQRANSTTAIPYRFLKFASCQPSKTLITGGNGQLGRSLAFTLRSIFGADSVLLSDVTKKPVELKDSPFCYLNILDQRSIEEVVVNNNIDTIIHFSALLSAVGEQNVPLALEVNSRGVQNVLEVARMHKLKVFVPSTIGAFGPTTPRDMTPDLTIQRPRTIYGVTKVYAELLGEYYFERFGVDFRSLRFPGIISAIQPGGDYAIKIFYDALMTGRHVCYLKSDTALPMMFDVDCTASVIQLLNAPSESLRLRTYNVTGFSFTPEEIAAEIRKIMPGFQIEYNICPVRQKIADSWPRSLNDNMAREDWQWVPEYDLAATCLLMMDAVNAKLKAAQKLEDIPKIAAMN